MTERPIIFSAEMVQAILAGRKTQTRRVVGWKRTPYHSITERDDGMLWPWRETEDAQDYWYPCPYGSPGDRLWVREAWRPVVDEHLWDSIEYRADGALRKPEVTNENTGFRFSSECDADDSRWRPSIHMPRWASRITLEITGVRVERLQDVSEADALAEGCRPIRPEIVQDGLIVRPGRSAVEEFRHLWEQINGPGSWAANPWVWVIEFERVTA